MPAYNHPRVLKWAIGCNSILLFQSCHNAPQINMLLDAITLDILVGTEVCYVATLVLWDQ